VIPKLQTNSGLVLIADSDPLVRWSLAHYLGRWFEVETVETLADARRLLGERSPAALIVGDEFPDGPGRDLVAEMTRTHPLARIVRITASSDARDENGVSCEGVNTLEKPFALADIAAMIGVKT
jgi:DNA-binding NtrC family response regulator